MAAKDWRSGLEPTEWPKIYVRAEPYSAAHDDLQTDSSTQTGSHKEAAAREHVTRVSGFES